MERYTVRSFIYALLCLVASGLLLEGVQADDHASGSPLQNVPVLTRPGLGGDWAALLTASPGAKAQWQPDGQTIKLVTGLDVATEGNTAEARAAGFLAQWGQALGITGGVQVLKASQMRGQASVQFRLVYEGLPVYGRSLTVTLNDAGRVRAVSSDAVKFGPLLQGDLSEGDAKAFAVKVLYRDLLPEGENPQMSNVSARRVVVADGLETVAAWHVQVPSLPLLTPVDVLIDSRDGRALLVRDIVIH